jgi:accessory gene regulator B
MISGFSKKITSYLCRNNAFPKEEEEIYQYGFEIIISTLLGFFITLAIGVLFGMGWLWVLYYGEFVILRQFTGGYHAKTYFTCNLVFAVVTAAVFSAVKLVSSLSSYSIYLHILLLGISVLIIWIYAPAENKNKPLSEKMLKRNHWLSVLFSLALSLFSVILFLSLKKVAVLTSVTVFVVAIMLAAAKFEEKCGEKNERI